ncbi:hypothetical protein CQW23_21819 [Capsicum baccatum]|uniref:Uncharacterized protein n=1 Tax=Capsicum baccatum TaxID=33114 RepID=A0A2G2VZ34_CAPBA|nr:hypothetical protein CQW23_21819 [Capsicum baccatum]
MTVTSSSNKLGESNLQASMGLNTYTSDHDETLPSHRRENGDATTVEQADMTELYSRLFCFRVAGSASTAAYKRWEKVAIAGVSLVVDAAEHLERTTIDKEAEPVQNSLYQFTELHETKAPTVVSLVADAGEHLERTTIDKDVGQIQNSQGE